jgi:hypothetical protein
MVNSLALRPLHHHLALIDAQDRAEFTHTIDENERMRVRELHDAMMQIARAVNPNKGCKAVAAKHPGRSGWSQKNLRAIYDEWEKEGRDWRWLVDRKRFPNARKAMLHPATEKWVTEKLVENQRVFSVAIQKIQGQWRKWYRTHNDQFAIPGFVDEAGRPVCPLPDAGHLPHQLQEHNLRRVKIAPAVVEAVRYGTAAMLDVLPKIPGTREDVRWMEWISGDDVELDVALYVPGYGKCRALQFGFWERSCSLYLPDAFIQRPRTPKNDGTWDKLKRRDFLYAVALLIERYGWPIDWKMHILCERGTATMNKAQAQWLYEISGGQIIVGWSSMDGEFIAAWEERKSGHSNSKGGHEGYHGILKNEMGSLRGQQGMDRDHAPAMDYGREKLMAKLDNAIVQMDPEVRGAIITPYLTAPELFRATYDAIQRINQRPNPQCEGFKPVVEGRPRGLAIEPMPYEQIMQWAISQGCRTDEEINAQVEWSDRLESRAERAARLSQEGRFLAPPPAAMVPFYEDNLVLRPIEKDYSFRFEKDGRKFSFVPRTPEERLSPGDKVVGFYRPDEQVIHLFTGKEKNRRFLTTYHKESRLSMHADAETKAKAFGRRQKFIDHAYAQVADATEEQVRQAQAEAEQNSMIIHAAGLHAGPAETPVIEAVQEIVLRRSGVQTAKAKKADGEASKAREAQRERLARQAERARQVQQQVSTQ